MLYGRLATSAVGGGPGQLAGCAARRPSPRSAGRRGRARRAATVTGSWAASRAIDLDGHDARRRPAAARGSASPARDRPRGRRRRAGGRRSARSAGSCWRRAGSSGRASWSAAGRAAGPARGWRPGPAARRTARRGVLSEGSDQSNRWRPQPHWPAPALLYSVCARAVCSSGGGVDRVARAADGAPGAQRELVEPVVAGRVDRARVAAGLALGQRGPVEAVGGRAGATGLGLVPTVACSVDRRHGDGAVDDLAARSRRRRRR